MALHYNQVVPWGRSYDEYVSMFGLTNEDLKKCILGCGDGPAAFNADLTSVGGNIISIDPIYQFSKEQIGQRIEQTYENVITQTRNNLEKFVWKHIKNVDELGKTRMQAMNRFLSDYELGLSQKRYVYAELPNLPFEDGYFELVLCSHFLFLYSENLSLEFHIESILEMLRVGKRVRIFPLLDVNANRSEYVNAIKSHFSSEFEVSETMVDYEFQKGGNTMLQIGRS